MGTFWCRRRNFEPRRTWSTQRFNSTIWNKETPICEFSLVPLPDFVERGGNPGIGFYNLLMRISHANQVIQVDTSVRKFIMKKDLHVFRVLRGSTKNIHMKILHTADWHLGKKLESINRLEEQRQVLQEITEIADAEDVDAVLVAGDIFDVFNPASEAVDLFYQTIKKLSKEGQRAVVAIAGNHDSPDRFEAPDPLARACGIILSGYPSTIITPFELASGLAITKSAPGFIELQLPRVDHPLRLLLTPYANEYRLKRFLGKEDSGEALRNLLERHWSTIAEEYCDDQGINILLAHLFFSDKAQKVFEEPEEEKPILHVGGAQVIWTENVPEKVDYVALGHLHRRQEIDRGTTPVVYAGSPLSYSFSESNQSKSVSIIECQPNEAVEYKKVPLKSGRPVLRARFEEIETAKSWLREHPNAIIELTIVSDTYLTAQTKKELLSINKDLFLIPEIRQTEHNRDPKDHINLNQKIEYLFADYFKFKNGGQAPNGEVLDLFKEVLAFGNEQ